MNTIKIIFFGILIVLLGSCVDYLEPYPNGDRQEEDIWKYPDMVQGLVGQCYDNMARNYNDNEGAYLDGATDNAVVTSSTNSITRLALGALTINQDIFQTYWDRDYRSIRLVNMFLKDRRGFNTKFLVDVRSYDPVTKTYKVNHRTDSLVRYRLQGEAFALRAYFYWDLLQKFGGKSLDGDLLGIPIVLDPVDIKGNLNFARNTYDECVKQIIDDCDSAYKYLPIAHRDRYFTSADLTYAGARYWGRFDGITTRAIKALVYLTWASPRFNPSNDLARWDSAAVNAKKVMDFKLTQDNVTNGFNASDAVNWFNPQFPGIVWASRSGSNEDMEMMFYPGGFLGNGAIGATQELVNSFPMKNGYPITDSRSLYNPAAPYANRDPRFYSMIFYNGATAKRNNTGAVMYTFENFDGGKDVAGARPTNSLTNYHIKKFVFMGWNKSDPSVNRQPHSKFFIRWDHMVLAFAEAANHVVGPNNAGKYGKSPKDAIAYLRTRKTYDGATGIGATDPYLTEVANTGEAAFDELVKNEWRIETCFEGNRFFDIRRWTTSLEELNKAVHGAGIVKNSDGTFTYDLNRKVQDRNFTSAYLPIPYQEMLRMNKLVQNEGWEGWR